MRILMLAPQPFYVERGTPIAVRLAAEALARAGHEVDLVTYHAGEDIALPPGVTHVRAAAPPWVRSVPIGFSLAKLACDLAMIGAAAALMRERRYDVIHAVEEAVFIGLALRPLSGTRLLYDADSILSEQIAEKWPRAGFLTRLLGAIERFALRRADLVLAVCPSVADAARRAGARYVHLLPDIAFPALPLDEPVDDIRHLCGGRPVALYVGNLEAYQGFDLLLEGLAAVPAAERPCLVTIGGSERAIERYQQRAAALGVAADTCFLGPRPLRHLQHYLAQADILCSPRVAGRNTPMKIYSYMGSGRAILATDIESHRQVLDEHCALLVAPTAAEIADGLRRLAADRSLRETLGAAAACRAFSDYSQAAFERRLQRAYASLVTARPSRPTSTQRA